MNSQDRWFVRFRGHTLGPLTTEQILVSIQKKEIGAVDKIALASNPEWKEIRAQESFRSLFPKASFDSLPSPSQVLYRKKTVAIPELQPPADLQASDRVKATEPKVFPLQSSDIPTAPLSEPPIPSAMEKKTGNTQRAAARKIKAKTPRKKSTKKIVAPRKPETKLAPLKKAPTEKETPPEIKPSEQISVSAPSPAKKEEIKTDEIEVSKILQSFPSRPEFRPGMKPVREEMIETFTFLENLRDWGRNEGIPSAEIPKKLPHPNPIKEVEIRITLSKAWIAAIGISFLFIAGLILFLNFDGEKKRDLKNFHLPDPSSPTIQPSIQNDPIPELKAPTRPKRD